MVQSLRSSLEQIRKYKTFLIYCLIGGFGTIIDLVLFYTLYNKFGVSWAWAMPIALYTASIHNFTLNTVFNFKTRDKIGMRAVSFFLVSTCCWFSTHFILKVFHEILQFDANVVKFFSIFFVLILNYNLNRITSFKKSPPSEKKNLDPTPYEEQRKVRMK